MPDIAAPILPSIAQFLAIGAPVAADAAVSVDFAALLAKQIVDVPQPVVPQTGKALPAGRQDLAALPLPALILPGEAAADSDTDSAIDTDLDAKGEGEEADAASDLPVSGTIIPILAMLTQPAPIRPEPRLAAAAMPDIRIMRAPAPELPVAADIADTTEQPAPVVKPAAVRLPAGAPIVLPANIALPTVAQAAGLQTTPAQPAAPGHSIAFVMRAAISPSPIAAPAPTSAPIFTAATVTATVSVAAPTLTPALAPAPTAEPVLETPIDDAGKPDVSAREAAPARSAPQPVAEARNAALALNVDPVAEPAQPKRTRSVASAMAELAALPGMASHDVRAVTAAPMAAAIEPLHRDRAAALVETIATLRSEARGDTLNLAIRHDDFGPISIRFEQSDDSVVVRFDTQDADLARLIADATPELKSAGETHGMRFERRDTMGAGNGTGNGAGTSGSNDAPRQGREQPRTQTYQRPQPRHAQDRGDIFA
jgi:hypothetical protein